MIGDAGVDAAAFKAEDKIRPLGKQIAGNDAKIGQTSLKLSRLEFPDAKRANAAAGCLKRLSRDWRQNSRG
ncbi:hypothetical protein [Neisseria yangbaofengii]|uniref:hypothetical protein n=1 Tax=Neisseria yangbaofengii TaxID=2709396 RepID=UPI0013EA5256|nr:hypothetical protein [Neisseria yangbaofengii]